MFIRVFRSLHSYQPGTFEGWLHRITTNVFLDKMRRKQRIRFDALSEESAARLPSREAGPEQAYDATHFDDDVQRALDALPPDFRAAVVLCDIEGLSYEEIATTLGIKLGTVRSRIHRGRALLRDALAHRARERRALSATPARPVRPAQPSVRHRPPAEACLSRPAGSRRTMSSGRPLARPTRCLGPELSAWADRSRALTS